MAPKKYYYVLASNNIQNCHILFYSNMKSFGGN